MGSLEGENTRFSRNAVSFVVGLYTYLRDLGYSVSDDFSLRFFELAEAADLSFADAEALEPVMESLIVHTQNEHSTFHDDYASYVQQDNSLVVSNKTAERIRRQKRAAAQARLEAEAAASKVEQLRLDLDRAKEEEAAAAMEARPAVGTKKQRTEAASKLKSLSKEFDKAFEGSSHKGLLRQLPKRAAGEGPLPSEQTLDEMADDLRQAAKAAMRGRHAMEMFSLIDDLGALTRGLKKLAAKQQKKGPSSEEISRQLAAQSKRLDNAQSRFDELSQIKLSDIIAQIEKDASATHRSNDIVSGNAVRCLAPGEADPLLAHKFNQLNDEQRAKISDYIKDNARKFKTRMTRNIRSGAHVKLDLPATCKKACSTMGVPISLVYEKPARNKARLLMFLDVSGSCKQASEMMLVFMHAMQEVFPGGCRTYAFVNSLYDISDVFETVNAENTAAAVLEQIPTKGVYSDYHRPFEDYMSTRFNEISKDTLVFFIGDARNNKNPTGQDNIKAIARKAKRAYWINTEDVGKWDQGDSVMSVYGQYMDRVVQVTTPDELIGFLTSIK